MQLRNKRILVISPQAWGKMHLTKHHYAIELAKRGNEVWFLNPFTKFTNNRNKIKLEKVEEHPNLYLIHQSLFFPYRIKRFSTRLYKLLMNFHLNNLLKKCSNEFDVVWCFDLNDNIPLGFFKFAFKLFHPVDEPHIAYKENAKKSNVLFSVTHEIIKKYNATSTPKYFINHGISEDFINQDSVKNYTNKVNNPRVGYAGNLLRKDIDTDTLIKIVKENPKTQFVFWGSYEKKQSNVGGGGSQNVKFINFLKSHQNVELRGVVSPKILSKEMNEMDAFLICYDVQKDQSKGTNYHKVMEYLSKGKVIVSNNITTYKDKPELVLMVEERDTNKQLLGLFQEVIQNLKFYNSRELQEKRISFALNNTYKKQIERIEKIINMISNDPITKPGFIQNTTPYQW